jgi:hypothetical protein
MVLVLVWKGSERWLHSELERGGNRQRYWYIIIQAKPSGLSAACSTWSGWVQRSMASTPEVVAIDMVFTALKRGLYQGRVYSGLVL